MAKCKGIRMMDTVFSSEVDTTIRKSAYRKIAFRLMPFLMLCYFCAYLDRVNVGFAKLQMMSDLHFSEAVYGLGAGIFFIGYFLCEVPSNIVLHKVGARRWIARIMITWGILSGCFAFVQTEWQFYTLRFLLGVAEAGLAPGLLLPHLLVPVLPPCTHDCTVVYRNSNFGNDWWPTFRFNHGPNERRTWLVWLAVDVCN